MNSLMPLILLAGIAISVIHSVESGETTPIIFILLIMRDITASTGEPMLGKNGCKEWHGKFKIVATIIQVSWLPARRNLKNHELAASGRSRVRRQDFGLGISDCGFEKAWGMDSEDR